MDRDPNTMEHLSDVNGNYMSSPLPSQPEEEYGNPEVPEVEQEQENDD